MADRKFKAFDREELGPEVIIGGRASLQLDTIPEYFNQFDRLVILSRHDTVDSFRNFSTGRDLVIEVGAGKGRFITELALKSPDAAFLGLETGLSLCGHALRRSGKKGATNVFMAWGDARGTIPTLVEPATVSAAYLLFPDPWWKKKHANRRHGPLMGETLANALCPGAFMYLKSDVEPYLLEIVAAFMSTGMYDRHSDPEMAISVMPLTDREVRLKAAGTPVFAELLVRR